MEDQLCGNQGQGVNKQVQDALPLEDVAKPINLLCHRPHA